MIDKIRKINPIGKILIIAVATIIVGFFGIEDWFQHYNRYHSKSYIDWEFVILTAGLTLLGLYFLLFGFKKK